MQSQTIQGDLCGQPIAASCATRADPTRRGRLRREGVRREVVLKLALVQIPERVSCRSQLEFGMDLIDRFRSL